MDTMQTIPGANILTAQLAQMSPDQIKAVLPRDFLIQVQDSVLKPNSITARHRAHLSRRKRSSRDHGTSANPLRRIAAANRAKAPGRNAKACNSFMCFRSYYNGLLKPMPQKEASPYLTILWNHEPFKAKWTMIAKAYSTLRDTVGKSHAPLPGFLELVCPAIGIIGPNEYLQTLNWVVTYVGHQRIFRQTAPPSIAGLPTHLQTTSMSEKEILELCMSSGFITPETPNFQLIKISTERPEEDGMCFTVLTKKDICQEAAMADPKAFAARALGIATDHPFFQVAESLPERLQLDDGTDLLELLEFEGIIEGEGAVQMDEEFDYEWTGNMSQLFSADEVPLNLERMQNNVPWSMIDINNAQVLDNTLIEGGASTNVFHDGRNEKLPQEFNFWESF